MKKLAEVLAATGLAAMLAGAALAQPPAKADWRIAPAEGDIVSVYPIDAGMKRIGGNVTLSCEGAADGRLENCKVVSETPASMGFGAAALELTPEYRLKPGPRRAAFEIPIEFFVPPPPTAEGLELPSLIRAEDAAQTYQAWPPEARALGIEATVSLRCVVTEEGRLRECKIERESAPNLGFGAAAVELAGLRRYVPAMKDGRPVAVSSPVSVAFVCGYRCTRLDVSKLDQPLAVRVPWIEAPTPADVAAVYPPEAARTKQAGKVVLDCDMRGDGSLRNCKASSEEPAGQGFAAAALKLTPRFKAPTARGVSLAGAKVFIPFAFNGEPLDTGTPEWNRMPTRSEFLGALPPQAIEKGVDGTVTLDCEVSATGVLANCKVAGETPAGLGLGAAALSLEQKFAMTLWSVDGQPTVGAKVRAPLAFEAPRAAAPGAPKLPMITAPEWARRPTAAQLADAYPQRAMVRGRSGSARLRCIVQATGDVAGCKIVEETPTGFGFGEAALRLSKSFRMKPTMVDGKPVMPDGAEVEFPVGFRLY